MTKIKKVLAATDFSEQSRLAVGRAARICQEHSARLELIHVIEKFPPPELISPDQFMEEARLKL
jgi:nucleotide-binding universal stress UspA family protein